MVDTKLYQKRSQAYLLLALYGGLAAIGGVLAGLALARGESSSNAVGFMLVFGAGMFVVTLVKSRRPQVAIYEDFLEVRQSRATQTVRYRQVTAVSRPDRNRLVISLREDEGRKNVVIWLKELDPADVDRLQAFLEKSRGKRK